jgi:carbohydrate kinase (thermoresistant glucokinase family)
MIRHLVLIVMGVSGAGKSTLAEGLRDRLGWPFQEGDSLHPPSNVQKMHAGIPLTDTDRAPWLDAIKAWIDARVAAGEPGLITCSALKRAYRDRLIDGRPQVRVLYLKADAATLEARLRERRGHFMPASLLESQLRTLEEPAPDEHPLVVPMQGNPAENLRVALDVIAGSQRPA